MSALPRSANYCHRFTLARSKFPHLLLLPARAGDSMVLDALLDYFARASVVELPLSDRTGCGLLKAADEVTG